MRHSSTMITSTARDGAQQWPTDDEHAQGGTQEEEHDEECGLGRTNPSLDDKGTTHKQRGRNQKGHSKSVLALQRLRMRSVL